MKLLWLGAPSRDNDKSIAEIQLFAEENASPVITAKTVAGAIYGENDTLTDTKANLTDGDVSTVWMPFAARASQAIILDMKERKELTGMIVTLSGDCRDHRHYCQLPLHGCEQNGLVLQ